MVGGFSSSLSDWFWGFSSFRHGRAVESRSAYPIAPDSPDQFSSLRPNRAPFCSVYPLYCYCSCFREHVSRTKHQNRETQLNFSHFIIRVFIVKRCVFCVLLLSFSLFFFLSFNILFAHLRWNAVECFAEFPFEANITRANRCQQNMHGQAKIRVEKWKKKPSNERESLWTVTEQYEKNKIFIAFVVIVRSCVRTINYILSNSYFPRARDSNCFPPVSSNKMRRCVCCRPLLQIPLGSRTQFLLNAMRKIVRMLSCLSHDDVDAKD